MEEPIVKVRHLSHRYSVQWAIRDISFDISRKGVLGLLGSNGAGKSTTMNIICGVLTPSEGEVYINGIPLHKHPVEAKRYIGFLPQKPPLYPDLTVEEYLTHCARMRKVAPGQVAAAVREAEEACGILHFKKRLIKNLSGGYQQRVGIAQAIVHQPAFVVLDEPTNGLDPNQITEVRRLIQNIAEERLVMLSTHILPEVQAICQDIKMIEHGQLVFSGSLEEFNQYTSPETFLLTLATPPSRETLLSLPGITGVESLSPTRFRMHFSGSPDITREIIELSVRQEWHLQEITLEHDALDSAFAQLSGKNTHHTNASSL